MTTHPPARQWTPEELAEIARAPATQRAYASDWKHFTGWAASYGLEPLPASPETVARYIAALTSQGVAANTLTRRVSAIAAQHREAGHAFDRRDPVLARVLAGAKRVLGTAPIQKAALTPEEVAAIVAAQPDTLTGLRNRALILITYAGAFRRAEVAALTTADLTFTASGVTITVRRGKGDQEAEGHSKAIAPGDNPSTCPCRALKRWIMAARLADGPVFRRLDPHGNLGGGLSGAAVAEIVKRAVTHWALASGRSRAEAARLAEAVGGHSLRAGALTAAAQAGATDWDLMAASGHRSRASLTPYIRRAKLYERSLTRRIGL